MATNTDGVHSYSFLGIYKSVDMELDVNDIVLARFKVTVSVELIFVLSVKLIYNVSFSLSFFFLSHQLER